MVKKYKKPLEQTRCIDNWKCPYCRNIITQQPNAMTYGNFSIDDGDFEEDCPECGETVTLFISAMYYARPSDENGVM